MRVKTRKILGSLDIFSGKESVEYYISEENGKVKIKIKVKEGKVSDKIKIR